MLDTLNALHQAVIASPEDSTVRLVYADALDETGDSTLAARAEFIRTQILLVPTPKLVPPNSNVATRRDELFEEHWLAWWRPVCKAAGLPEPHVPGRRVRDKVARTVRRPRRTANWPYTHTTSDTTIHADDYGVAIRFAGGFPAEIRFVHLDVPEGGPELVHRWGDAMPLVRLSFASHLSPEEWDQIDGSHLSRLTELSFDRLSSETASHVAQSPHLTALTRLTVSPVGSDDEVIRSLIASPSWSNLRTLQFVGRLSPAGVRAATSGCTLKHLEELELTLGDPGELRNPIGEIIGGLLRLFRHSVSSSTPSLHWSEFGPPLELLAATPWVGGLRRLTLRTADVAGFAAIFAGLLGTPGGPEVEVVPGRAIRTLADALCPDKLERLELPAAIIDPSTREELAARFGDRVAFT